MVVLAGLIAYNVVSRDASPGPGWLKAWVGLPTSRAKESPRSTTAPTSSPTAVFPCLHSRLSYDEGVEGIHEVVSYCPSGEGYNNEPHSTQYNMVGSGCIAGPAPSSTRSSGGFLMTVLDDEVWVDPEPPVSGVILGATGTDQQPRTFCQS